MGGYLCPLNYIYSDIMQLWIIILILLFWFVYLLGSIIFVALSNFWYHDNYLDEDIHYSRERPVWVPKDGFLFDLHSHSTASDGLLTPRQLVLWHISNGYNGMVISDHNTQKGYEEAKKAAAQIDPNFLVIPGVEFSSLRVHLNLIGFSKPFTLPRMIWPSKKKIASVINLAHREGALVQFNHRDWYFHKKYLPKDWYLDHNIDGWEVYNGFGFVKNQGKKVMFPSAGTDVHDPAKHLCAYTDILTENKSVEGVMQALREGKTKVYLDLNAEKSRLKPERGKKKENLDRKKFIRHWFLLYWAGNAAVMGPLRWLLIILLVASIILGVYFSFI